MNSDILQTLIRSLFKFLAAYLATRGLTVDDSTREALIGGAIGLCSVLWGVWHRSTPNPQPNLPGLKLMVVGFLMLGSSLLLGCASTYSKVTETSTNGTVRTVVFRGRTFWDSQSALAKLRATGTDKVQGITIAGLDESSSGTNAVTLIEGVTRAAVQAAVGTAK